MADLNELKALEANRRNLEELQRQTRENAHSADVAAYRSLVATRWGVMFSLLAFLAAAGFGIWDAIGDRKWQAKQLQLLQEISTKLDQANTVSRLESQQEALNSRIGAIDKDLESIRDQ